MAKIVLVTEQLHIAAGSLAKALRSQSHEVIVLTSREQENLHHFQSEDIQVLRFFKNWNLLEALQISPTLFAMQPQVIHLLLDTDSLNPAQSALALFAKGHPACILATSLLHLQRGLHKRNPVRYLLQESDIVTCPTIETMGHLRGLSSKKSQGRGILPPVLNLGNELKSHQSEIIISELPLLEHLKNQKYIVIPFREIDFSETKDFFLRLETIAKTYHVVLWGSLQSWSLRSRKRFENWLQDKGLEDRWTVTGQISAGTTESLLEGCEALWLAGQDFTPVEMTDLYLKAIQAHSTLVLARRQAQVHAALWRNGQNCWILEDRKLSFETAQLLKQKSLRVPEILPESIAREKHWIDIPLNDLSRLYNKALMSK